MTKEEILNKTTWDYNEIGNCPIFVSLFNKEIPFIFFQDHIPNPSISEKMIECVNDVLNLSKSNQNLVQELLWEECCFAFTISDYGFEPKMKKLICKLI